MTPENKVTAESIALKFSEVFQNQYPQKPIWKMMDDLRKDIDDYAQSRIQSLEEENRKLREEIDDAAKGVKIIQK